MQTKRARNIVLVLARQAAVKQEHIGRDPDKRIRYDMQQEAIRTVCEAWEKSHETD